MSSLARPGSAVMLCPMRFKVWAVIATALLVVAEASPIPPEAVAILCNARDPQSKHLAEVYRKARNIPAENVVTLDMPPADISRDEYEKFVVKPLRSEFTNREWWKRAGDAGGSLIPMVNKIRVIVAMSGVPLRIMPTGKGKPGTPNDANPIAGHDEAAFDSELAMFGIEGLPIDGVLQNKFYRSEKGIMEANLPFMVLTARIDGPSVAVCERMIHDAVEAEQTGLWGKAYVDIANKIPQADQWLENVVKDNVATGIPTVVDRFNETLPTNYPMTDAALYYGWYDWNVSGPFLNPRFHFRKGAVAMHLHSFSAEHLRSASENWCGPLLDRGAAATVGNVFEPYLHLTHDFSILHKSLLAGYSFGEAAWMAMPVTSWQGVVIGDPLYRPFLHLDGGGEKQADDIEYRALRAAAVEWKDDPLERLKQLDKAAMRMKSGVLAEAIGLEQIEHLDPPEALRWFRIAQGFYVKPEDKLRQELHLIAMDRAANRKDTAIQKLRDMKTLYGMLPEGEALKGWLNVLAPPPPPVKNQ